MIKEHFIITLIITGISALLIFFNPYSLLRINLELTWVGNIFFGLTIMSWLLLVFVIVLEFAPPVDI